MDRIAARNLTLSRSTGQVIAMIPSLLRVWVAGRFGYTGLGAFQPCGYVVLVGECFGHAKYNNERQHRRASDETKLLLSDDRQDGALHANHRAYERVDDHEQRELRHVLVEPQTDRRTVLGNDGGAHADVPASSVPRLNARTRSISA